MNGQYGLAEYAIVLALVAIIVIVALIVFVPNPYA